MVAVDVVTRDKDLLDRVAKVLHCNAGSVRCFGEEADALKALGGATPPDLMIVDLDLSGMKDRGFLRHIRERTTLPVVIMAPCVNEVEETCCLAMGADDFIISPFSPHVFLERVRAILRRCGTGEFLPRNGDDGSVLEHGFLRMSQERYSCHWKGQEVVLTVTEFMMLWALAQRPGVVKSRDSLMDVTCGDQVYVNYRTIDTHIKRLRRKFRKVDPGFSAVETLYGVGYCFRG